MLKNFSKLRDGLNFGFFAKLSEGDFIGGNGAIYWIPRQVTPSQPTDWVTVAFPITIKHIESCFTHHLQIMNTSTSFTSTPHPQIAVQVQFQQALTLHQQGQLGQARSCYQAILAQYPQHFDTLHLLGVCEAQAGHLEQAVKMMHHALLVNPQHPVCQYNYGNALRAQQQMEAALSAYNRAIALKTDYWEAYYNRALLNASLGKWQEALVDYKLVLKQSPHWVEVWCSCGDALQMLGKLSEALNCYDHAITIKPDFVVAYYNRGNALQALGQSENALQSYTQALALAPNYSAAHFNCGVVLAHLERWEQSLQHYQKAIQLDPKYSKAYLGAGLVYQAQQQFADAQQQYQRALAIQPDFVEAHCNLAAVLRMQNLLGEALQHYSQVINIQPDCADAYCGRGLVWQEQEQYMPAIADYQQAINLKPDYAEAYSNLGNAYTGLGRIHEALACHNQAITLNPNLPEAYSNRGNTLKELNQLVEAVDSYQHAIRLRPNYVNAHSNLGWTWHELRQIDKALESYNRALSIDPHAPEVHWNRALTYLLKGDFANGWQEYEWRWQRDTFTSPKRNFTQPLWLNQCSITGKTLLLHTEQGIGDSLQFCRYAPLLQASGIKVLLEAERPLMEILNLGDGVTVLEKGQKLPHFDYHSPLMSLPLACGTSTLADIPARVPYLFAPLTKIQAWQTRLGKKSKPRVGLVWSSGVRPGQMRLLTVNSRRNLPFALIAQLNRPDIDFYSLQKGEPAESMLSAEKQQYWAGDNLHVLTTQLHDLSDTAALIMNLDLVISVCTSVTHLSGALGQMTWTLLPFSADWRWLLERDDSPWYPTMRLFRQPQAGDWDSVITHVQQALDSWLTQSF